ncbi:MAG: DEAD/DEAH box helicase [Akkermansiaceae bacterium]|nr:DEAD/DEAH box helicase [Akkermansiaceae bacterium]
MPSPEPFFQSADWHHRFDEHILAHGKKLSSPKFLTALNLETIPDGAILTGRVDDHDTEVNLWPESGDHWDYDTSCTCDFGSHCPHAAAAIFRASRPNTLARLLRGGGTTAPEPEVRPQQSAISPPPFDLRPLTPVFRLSLAEEPATGRAVQLLLQALKTANRNSWLTARPTVHYGEHEFPLIKSSEPSPVARDKAAEFRAIEFLTSLGLTTLSTNPTYRFLLSLAKKQSSENSAEGCWFPEPHLSTPAVFWPWFRANAAPKLRDAGWQVEIDPQFGHDVHDLSDDKMQASLELAPGGWFTLSVGIDLAGKRLDLLPILTGLLDGDTLDQLQDLEDDDTHLIYLPNGGALKVPAGRLRVILHHLAALTDPKIPNLHPLDAAALVGEAALPIDPPPALIKLRAQLATTDSTDTSYRQPEGLRAELRTYQKEGVEWLNFLKLNDLNGILADDMGLGKTLQTLTHILQTSLTEPGPVLVIAPTSVVPNWVAEIKKFTPSLTPLMLQGPKRRRLFAHIPHADIIITSFALLQRDIDELKKHDFRLAILDEAQHIKNASAKVSQAACQLNTRRRLCLSGTPIENSLSEVWSLFRFLIPGFLGSQAKFKTVYQNPIEKEDDEERRDRLRNRLGPLILRRTKDQVATELPPKTILTHPVELSSGQRDLYETVRATMDKQVREAIAIRGLDQSQFAILDALLKLRQICCHPSLLKLPEAQKAPKKSAKFEYLFDLLETLFAEGRRVLLFSQFTTMLSLIEDELKIRRVSYLKLTGNSKDRGGLVDDFQNGTQSIFLISLKAGGTGLNLTAADTVIHYDPWWNPAAENQATDRAYRIGQDKPVFVHKLICAGTVEDRINQLQQKKAHLADSLLSGAAQGAPDAQSLKSLLAPL